MSIKKIMPGPGQSGILVRKGKPLDTSACPACGGTAVPSTNARGQAILKCTRCRAEISSKPF